MIEISDSGIIELTRGDYVEIPLFINQGNRLYPIRYSLLKDPSAVLHFVVRKVDETIDRASLKKSFNFNSSFTKQRDIVILIKPEDTLKLQPGKYYYSVLLTRPVNGCYCKTTVIPDRLFILV